MVLSDFLKQILDDTRIPMNERDIYHFLVDTAALNDPELTLGMGSPEFRNRNRPVDLKIRRL